MLHQLLTRENPRRHKPPIPAVRRFNAAVDQQLEKILVTCTAVDREQRPDSARTLARSLAGFRESRLKTGADKLRADLGKLVLTLFTPPEENEVQVAFQSAIAHTQRVKKELSKPVVVEGGALPWTLVLVLALGLAGGLRQILAHFLTGSEVFFINGAPVAVALTLVSFWGSTEKRSVLAFGCFVLASIFLMVGLAYPGSVESWLLFLLFFALASGFG
jgi:hypothetical protein